MNKVKPSARFLPTLTEVVQLAPVESPPPAMVSNVPSDLPTDLADRALVMLEARMAERLQALVNTQAHIVLEGLRDEMRLAVADAVKEALREGQ